MFLPWLNLHIKNVNELLYHLRTSPPPEVEMVSRSPAKSNAISHNSTDMNTSAAPPLSSEIGIESLKPSLFALIIGISVYLDPDIIKLPGAMADAEAVQDFLIKKLCIPEGRIVNLRDEQATREAIINAFQDLSTNPAIGSNDPILVYYAGHGSEADSPSQDGTKIQMILPYDFSLGGSDNYQGQGLFDMTLSSLLTRVANNKSDNITVIFDCCHSGSGTREENFPDEHVVSRRVALPSEYTICPAVFKEESEAEILKQEEDKILNAYQGVFVERASHIPPEYAMHALRSHVLLSACTKSQTAKEINGRGAFTSALLDVLKEGSLEELAYRDVIQRLHLPKRYQQDPQCEGVNQNRTIFTSKVVGRSRNLYHILGSERPGEYTLKAGETHGIARKALFAVYADDKMTLLIGFVVAQETTAFRTKCIVLDGTATFNLPRSAYAVQTRAGEEEVIRIFIEPKDPFLDLFLQVSKDGIDDGYRSFQLVNSIAEDPVLILGMNGPFVQFNITNRICHLHGLTRMPYADIRADESGYLRTILRGAADFYWNLRHTSRNRKNILTNQTHLECFRVTSEYTLDHQAKAVLRLEPVGDNLNIDGTIFIDVGLEAQYGFKIKNNSDQPLYAALFYFDVSDLSIVDYHLPGTAAKGKVDFCLPAKESLCVGFGDGGSPPFEYFLRDNQEVDIGFLKLYVSSEIVDFSTIIQQSPFDQGQRASRSRMPEKTEVWDTIIIPVVQKKGHPDPKPISGSPEFDKNCLGDDFIPSFDAASGAESDISMKI